MNKDLNQQELHKTLSRDIPLILEIHCSIKVTISCIKVIIRVSIKNLILKAVKK